MLRIIAFLILIAALALGAAWIADQSGDIALTWNGWHIQTSLPVFAAALGVTIAAAVALWAILRELLRLPVRLRHAREERRRKRGRQAITRGLVAIGSGDAFAARRQAQIAQRLAQDDPLALLLEAQAAQLDGDRDGARRAFNAMAERRDTRLLGLRGLFVEAQRADDPLAAVTIAEEALRAAPGSSWASQAVLGFRCARGDWNGALTIVDNDLAAGLIGKAVHRRWRGVLLTARALELDTSDRDQARTSIMEAVKLAPTLVPAVVLAARFLSESQQVRRAMRLIETAWVANPHPDLADAYAHVRLGDSALERLSRTEALAAMKPEHFESALALARAAIDARDFAKARTALAPLAAAPTQRVAMLMAEIERSELDNEGLARQWTLRAVRAAPDAVWTADGYISDRWHPVSPVTGRIDAFQWQVPLAALPSQVDGGAVITAEPPAETETDAPALLDHKPAPTDGKDGAVIAANPDDELPAAPAAKPDSDTAVAATPLPPSPPVFRPRKEFTATPAPVIPLVRAPDDPGIDGGDDPSEFADRLNPPPGQIGGWRGFLSRWGG